MKPEDKDKKDVEDLFKEAQNKRGASHTPYAPGDLDSWGNTVRLYEEDVR